MVGLHNQHGGYVMRQEILEIRLCRLATMYDISLQEYRKNVKRELRRARRSASIMASTDAERRLGRIISTLDAMISEGWRS